MDNALITSSNAGGGFLARLSARGKATLVLGALGLIALATASWLWSKSPDYRILFTNLSDRDGGAIIAQLSQMNIPYKNADGGTILVPGEKVHEARLKLASQGLPKGSLVGFELMENQKFGVTQFQEQVNYQRGLEGELSRSIQALASVSTARVHLALPKQSGFMRDKQPPTASVILTLFPGKALDRAQVAGISHLVSSSVPEMNVKNVSIVDQQGNLLSGGRENQVGMDAAQLDYVAQIEASTIRRIEDILEPIVGRGNARAQVTADIDFSQSEQTAETYKPNQGADAPPAVRSQQSSESSQPGPAVPSGVPGALSNQPPVPATAPISGPAAPLNPNTASSNAAGNSTRKDAVTNFEVDKTVKHISTPNGQVRRLTAAVVINHRNTLVTVKTEPEKGAPEAKGDAAKAAAAAATPAIQSAPLSEKEMQDIQALVREAMGFNEKRGDSLNVLNAPFSTTEIAASAPEVVPFWKQPEVVALGKEAGKALLFLVMAIIMVFGAVRPALRAFATPRPGSVSTQLVAVEGGPPVVVPKLDILPAPNDALGTARLNAVEQVRQGAKQDPATVANVVRSWVNEPEDTAAAAVGT